MQNSLKLKYFSHINKHTDSPVELVVNLPPLHSWSSLRSGRIRPRTPPPKHWEDQRWNWPKSLRRDTARWVISRRYRSNTDRKIWVQVKFKSDVWLPTIYEQTQSLFTCCWERGLRDKRKKVMLTCNHTGQVNHSHFKSFVDQFQGDTQQQLHQQVPHNVLHTKKAEVGIKYQFTNNTYQRKVTPKGVKNAFVCLCSKLQNGSAWDWLKTTYSVNQWDLNTFRTT